MRLGYYYHIPARIIDNKSCTAGFFGRFLDSLATRVEQITLFLHAPNANENANFDFAINSPNVKLILLEPRRSVSYRILNSKKFTQQIIEHKAEIDALIIRGPTPLLPVLSTRIRPVPVILQIVGDYLAGVDSLPQPAWRREIIRLWSWYNLQGEFRAAQKSLVIVNSRQLWKTFVDKAKEIIEIPTTTLNLDDIYSREDTCQEHPIQILYVGRIDPAKGLLDMVRAVASLVDRGEDVELNLVGWVDSELSIVRDLKQLSLSLGIADRIKTHGYKAIGPELFSFYKDADIFLLASQCNEGFPRAIWEAMAHGLPVVATRVGSIPDYIGGIAELVEPMNIQELANSIQKIIHDPNKRKRYIEEGYNLARKNTLEIRSSQMSVEINEYLKRLNLKDKYSWQEK